MQIERILVSGAEGPLLGGLSWRPPSGGRHSLRKLHEARNLAVDATHYTLFASGQAQVYGLFQPRASEESVRLPKGVLSAAHCFAARVGAQAPNGALILTVPSDGARRDGLVYVVVLEDGMPAVDSLTSEMEARNALGSEDRPIWSDTPDLYPNCEAVDFHWLAQGAGKGARVVPIPMNPWPLVTAALLASVGCAVWFSLREAQRIEAMRAQERAIAQSDPVPKYLAALDMQSASMAVDRQALLAAVERMFDDPVRIPGWRMKSRSCSATIGRCEAVWVRQGGTYDELTGARPHETLQWIGQEGNPVPSLDTAATMSEISIKRSKLEVPGSRLPTFKEAIAEAGSLFQIWKTAELSIDLQPPRLWPRVDAVPVQFDHPRAILSGAITLGGVPGPFILEALRTAPPWVSWEAVSADIGDGDVAGQLKFKATGNYYVSLR